MAKKAKPSRKEDVHLPPWREIAKPHSDIIQGKFDLGVFAANLSAVHRGEAPLDYRDPDRFFERTFLTNGLRELAVAVLQRLAGKPGGEAVVDLITSFGGGKTHALIALYHLAQGGPAAKRWTGVLEVLKGAGLEAPPKARVAVLSGEDVSPVRGVGGDAGPVRHTLWGELAWQLGGAKGYEALRKDDEKRIAPTADDWARLMAGGEPTLILIDEALQYISRAKGERVEDTTLAAQTLNFIKSLTEAVANRTSHACVVATLPASVTIEVNREDEEDYHRLSHMIRRVERTRRLAEGEEIYEIVRRRLFQDTGPEEDRKKVIAAYLEYYRDHADAFPREVGSPAYARKMERAYPFHPEFLDVLNERWSAIPNFQRTRGVLRMLALLISDLHKDDPLPLIHLSSARLSNRDFRSEVLGQIDARQFDAVIEADVSGTGGRSRLVDDEGSETYQREHLAERTATAVFLYSFGGAAGVSGAALSQVRLAVLRPGLEPAFVTDVLNEMRKRLYYLDAEGNQYRFTVQPNLNAILVEHEGAVDREKLAEAIRVAITNQFRGDKFRIVAFPAEPRDVPDQPALSLVIMDPEHVWGKTTRAQSEKVVREILAGGTTHRSNRNALVFSVAEEGNRLHAEARTILALDAVDRLYARTGKLADPQKRDLDRMRAEGEKALKQAVWSAYRFAMTPGEEDKLEEYDLGRPIHREGQSLQDLVWEHLVSKERIAPKLGPGWLASDRFPLWPREAQNLSIRVLKDAFGQYTYLPMIPGPETLKECIAEGIRQGVFGYALGAQEPFDYVIFQEYIAPDAVDMADNVWLLRPELARRLHEPSGAVSPPEPGPLDGGGVTEPGLIPRSAPAPSYRTVVIEGELDWKKWLDFYDGVVKPIVQAGAAVQVQVRLDATSAGGIPRNVIEITVSENIAQRGLAVRVVKGAETSEQESA